MASRRDLNDFLRKAQAMDYEGERAMFEAYGRNKYESTGVIQWMLNNAWPSLLWNLYDYYLVPAGATLARKKRVSRCTFSIPTTTILSRW